MGPKSDAEVLNEVLVLGEYEHAPRRDPGVVLDLGSHIGVSLLFFRTRYPRARIIGVEPNPEVFPRLERNAAQLEGVEVHRLAVASRDGELDFYPAKQSWTSSTRRPSRDARRVTVHGRTLDSLLDDLGLERVGLLKLDIEAGEEDVLRSSRRLGDVGAVVGEFSDSGDLMRREAFFSLFSDFSVTVKGRLGEHTTFVAVRPAGNGIVLARPVAKGRGTHQFWRRRNTSSVSNVHRACPWLRAPESCSAIRRSTAAGTRWSFTLASGWPSVLPT